MADDTKRTRLHVRIGGEAGQGLETVTQMFCKALVRSGYGLLTSQHAMSRIRGGHNFFSIYAGLEQPQGPGGNVDLLVAFSEETVGLHQDQVAENGFILLGEDMDDRGLERSLRIPYSELVEEKIVHNVLALGVMSNLLGIGEETISSVVKEAFEKKGDKVVSTNQEALQKGGQWIQDQSVDFRKLSEAGQTERTLAMSGSQAMALGAMAAGVDFCSFYPMSPSTSVAMNLIAHADTAGIVCEQAEDEIAAVNMAIGASSSGARSLVPTSGGGFALMGEGVSLIGVAETPMVIVLAQRPGPATGLPTRTEQGDLELALYTGHGEFPRAILAPGTQEDCFFQTHKALDLAERFQTLCIVLVDQYLTDSIKSVAPFKLEELPEIPGPGDDIQAEGTYERYAWSETGVSPRIIPGKGKPLVVTDSHEHTPDGHITEDQDVRNRMVEKRLKKMEGLKQEVFPPNYQGPDDPDLLLVSWGSSQGAVQEAAGQLEENGRSVATLHFSQVWPILPDQFLDRLQKAGSVVSVESNATAQFARLIRRETGFEITKHVLRYDGRPLDYDYILAGLKEQQLA